MAFSSDLDKAARLAKIIGVREMMMLAGWYGGQTIRIPNTMRNPDHILAKIIGQDAYRALVLALGGELLMVPLCDVSPLRTAGLVYRLTKKGINTADLARLAGISPSTVHSIRGVLQREGYADLADQLPEVTA